MTNQNDKPAASELPAAVVTLHGERTREITLEYPAEFEGVTYDKVTIRRPTRAEVAKFVEDIKTTTEPELPIHDLPKVVFDNLDPDDYETVNEAMFDFLPRSLQTALALAQESGADMSPPSQASSEAASSSTSE